MTNEPIVTATPSIEGKRIVEYKSMVFGEATFGSGIGTELKGLLASITGSRTSGYENRLNEIRMEALSQMRKTAQDLGANAVVAVKVDYETLDTVLMVSASGTAVVVE